MGRTGDSARSVIVIVELAIVELAIVELAIVGLVIVSLRLDVVGRTSSPAGNMMTASSEAASDATRTA